MTVEKRDSTTAHGLKPFPVDDVAFRTKQLEEAIILNAAAGKGYMDSWSDETISILKKYIPLPFLTKKKIEDAVAEVMDMYSWREVSEFVVDDECSEFYNMALKFCKKSGAKHVTDHGFIDGTGIGYGDEYLHTLKGTIEKCFDAKYFYDVRRPLEWAFDELGLDLSSIANAIHPGHFSYPAGHGTKFLTCVDVLRKVFKLSRTNYRKLLIAACVASMGRSGSLIHYPVDNLAGGYFTDLKEFKNYTLIK